MYYACLRVKKDKKDKDGPQKIIKKAFATREEARAYLTSIYDDQEQASLYDQIWTE